MITLSSRQVNEIAEQLDFGFRVFCHKTTGNLLYIIDNQKFPDVDWDDTDQEAQNEIEANRGAYIEIEAMSSGDSYQVMADFAGLLTDNRLQALLFRALDKRGPFRAFRDVIDNAGDYRQQWFAFKHQRYVDWVNRQLPVED